MEESVVVKPATLFLTDIHRMQTGYGGLASKARQIEHSLMKLSLKASLRHVFSHRFRHNPGIRALVSDPAAEQLREFPLAKIVSYGSLLFAQLDDLAYSDLHAYADSLHEKALAAGPGSGLSHLGYSSFQITETRWLVQLALWYAAYFDIILKEIESDTPSNVYVLNRGSIAYGMAKKICLEKKIPLRHCSPVQSLPLKFLEAEERAPRDRKSIEHMIRYWRRHSTGQALSNRSYQNIDFLFVAYKPRTIERVRALLPEIKKQGIRIGVLCLSREDGRKNLADLLAIEQSGQKVFWCEDYVSPAFAGKAAGTILKNASASIADFLSEAPCNYRGFRIEEFFSPYLSSIVPRLSAVSSIFIEAAHNFLDRVGPKIVVNFEEYEINRAITLVAKKAGIPTIAYYCLSPASYPNLIRRYPDRLACSGPILSKLFTSKYQWRPGEVEIVGDPAVDQHALSAKGPGKAAGDAKKKKRLLLLTTYAGGSIFNEHIEEFYQKVFRCSRSAGYKLFVKVHPQQNMDDVRLQLTRLGISAEAYFHHESLEAVAADCDAGVMMYSTAASKLLTVGIPIVSLLPDALSHGLWSLYNFSEEVGIATLTMESDDRVLIELLENDRALEALKVNGRSYVELHSGPFDGRSAERFCTFAKSLVQTDG